VRAIYAGSERWPTRCPRVRSGSVMTASTSPVAQAAVALVGDYPAVLLAALLFGGRLFGESPIRPQVVLKVAANKVLKQRAMRSTRSTKHCVELPHGTGRGREMCLRAVWRCSGVRVASPAAQCVGDPYLLGISAGASTVPSR